jgi:hypothetical protein
VIDLIDIARSSTFVSGNPRYQLYGWQIAQKIDACCKSQFGYSTLIDVTDAHSRQDNQPSYFLAETLKYLYLLFSAKDDLPANKFVMNTEGHPLKHRNGDKSCSDVFVPLMSGHDSRQRRSRLRQ